MLKSFMEELLPAVIFLKNFGEKYFLKKVYQNILILPMCMTYKELPKLMLNLLKIF